MCENHVSVATSSFGFFFTLSADDAFVQKEKTSDQAGTKSIFHVS